MKTFVLIFLAMFSTIAIAKDADKCFKILSVDGQFFIVQPVTDDGSGPKSPFSTSFSANLNGQFAKLAGLVVGNDELKVCVPSADGQRDYEKSYIVGLGEWAYHEDWQKGYFKV